MKTPQDIIDKRKELWTKYQDIEKDKEYTQAVANYLLSPEGETLRIAIKNNSELLIEMFFVVVDKEQNTVPFFLNELQIELRDSINKAILDYKTGKRNHLKFLLLKGRQGGFTTYITADQLARSITQRNFAGFTLADLAENTESIFTDKAKFFYDHLPEMLKPTEKYNNRRELHFEKLNSRWRVATAGNKDIGRSKTLNYFHGSEAAFWDNLQSVMTGLGEALTKDSIQILETTANGYNEYKDMWDDENNWEKLFFEWWKTSEYRLNFESKLIEDEFKQLVSEAEKPEINDYTSKKWIYYKCRQLLEFYKLNWDQIYWYYNKWRDKREKILQEYPCSPDEAFLASGRCVFDKEVIIERKELLKKLYEEKPPKRGYFTFKWNNPEAKDYIIDKSIEFLEAENGYIYIYEEVKNSNPYVIGGDTKGEGSDFFTGTAINNITGKRVATLHGDLSPDNYTHQMYCLGKHYNYALIGIEVNFDLYPIKELERLKYRKQYKREIIDKISTEKQYKHGWKTDGNTRPLIISNEIVLIRDNIELFTHIGMLDECLTFVYDKNGRPDAESGKHDDILMSDMIANQIRSQQTMKKEVTKTELKGYYTESELKDMGYSKMQIKKLMKDMKSY